MGDEVVEVLLIEDNFGDARLIREMLRDVNGFSYKIQHVDRFSSGVEVLNSNHIEVVVLDLTLPDSCGYDTFSQLHARFPQVPMVLLTGLDDEELGIKAVRNGAQDYLVKGNLDGNLLARTIRYALERKLAADALRKTEQLFEKMFSSLRDAVFIIDARSNKIVNSNLASSKLFGYCHEEMIGCSPELLCPLQNPAADRFGNLIFEGSKLDAQSILEVKMKRKNGEEFYAEVNVVHLDDEQHHVVNIVLIIRDITARKRAQETLRESQERYMLAMLGANDGLWDWNIRTNEIYYSPRWKAMLGYSEGEIGSSPDEWFNRIHPDDRDKVSVALAAHLKGLASHFESEHRMLHRDETYRWALTRGLAVRDEKNIAYRMAGSQTDVTARKQAEEQLLHDAFHDNLTGLPNRALFLDRLGRTIEHAKRRNDYLYAILFLDLDRFKIINDSLGHSIGDQLLIKIGNVLQGCLRSGDTVARLGGDEFVILLEEIRDTSDAIHVAKRVQHLLSKPFSIGQQRVYTSASIGVVLSTLGYDSREDILRDADIAMYQAKLLGKAQYVVFNPDMRNKAFAQLELENDLHHALERNEFELHYQPIIALSDDRIVGFEALLRWKHPKNGYIGPAEFIPVAEETGLICEIGHWVLKEACIQACKWQTQFPVEPPLMINVNISIRQFMQPDFIEQVQQLLDETGLPAKSLGLEITENMLMENAESVNNLLIRLRSIGVRLQIDDFGTGYSSLSYLQRFPIDTLKIDYSFISRLGKNGESSEIVKTILVLARELGMDSVAEGVETKNQLKQLKALQCQYGQGYYISRPVTPSKVSSLLKSNREINPNRLEPHESEESLIRS